MRPRLAFAVVAGLALLAGCSPSGVLKPQLAPETSVFIQGPVDTVSYKVELHWFGTDPDGYVTAYEIRFLNPDQPADSQWVRTTRTDSVFRVFTPDGTSEPTFEVRAIDDAGLKDPTPARQLFTFRNLPPSLQIVSGPGPSDSTYASVTISWAASDPDGDIGNATYRVWLDGREANADVASGTTFTVPSDQFRVGGVFLTGPRKVYVQAVDEAGYATQPESLSWFVRAPSTGPRARLLIVDDVPGNTGPQGRQDTLFVNTAIRNLPGDSFSILRLEFTQPFRSTADLEQTLGLFDAVIWYRGSETSAQPILTNYREGVARYLESGGKFFIESQKVVSGQGSSGIFPESWVSEYFGSDFLHKRGTAVVGDSSVAWDIAVADDAGHPVILRSTVYSDSLRLTLGGYNELRGFGVRDTNDVALWARTGNLTQRNTVDLPVGVTVPQPGGGRLVAVTVPLRSCNGFNTLPRFLAKVFEQLGLTSP